MSARGIFVVGTSHSVASAEAREQLHVETEEILTALRPVLTAEGLIEEAVPLATCGRLEVYGVSSRPERAARFLTRLASRRPGAVEQDVVGKTFRLHGADAVEHLFRVASGLDSVVHGEAQILGQVKDAAHDPLGSAAKGTFLHRLFDAALATGKRVRSETEIGRGAASLASAGLALLRQDMGSLDDTPTMVIGAGETGALVARLLAKAGVPRIIVANRTLSTAKRVAEPLGAEAIDLESVPARLPEVGLVIGAAGHAHHLLGPTHLREPRTRPLWLLDLAHPRNFDTKLAEIDDVHVVDLDEVAQRVEAARSARLAHLPKAEEIVRDAVAEYQSWLRSRPGVTVLRSVRETVLTRAEREAHRLSKGRPEEDREALRLLARSLARTLLHEPTVALRAADPGTPEGRKVLETAPTLFGVSDDPGEHG
ncbi:MAG: glutamyl-tRNA reductase [Gemmatimonadota bacterium]